MPAWKDHIFPRIYPSRVKEEEAWTACREVSWPNIVAGVVETPGQSKDSTNLSMGRKLYKVQNHYFDLDIKWVVNTNCLSFCIFLNMWIWVVHSQSMFSEWMVLLLGSRLSFSLPLHRCKRQDGKTARIRWLMTWWLDDLMSLSCCHEWCWSAHAEGWKADLQLALWPGISSSKLFWCHLMSLAYNYSSMCFHVLPLTMYHLYSP